MPVPTRYFWAVAATIALVIAACAAHAPNPTPTVAITPAPTCAPGVARPADVTMLDVNDVEVVGLLASFHFCDGSSEAPWPAAATVPAVELTNDEINVLVSIAEGQSFLQWEALYAPTSATTPRAATILSSGTSDSGVDTVSFAGPPTGEWVISMTLTYPGEIGSATYFWRATVP